MMKARYISFFSYIGTHFRSSEKLWLRAGRNYPDPDSVQGSIELALLKLKSLTYPNLSLSSRTDQGVHALKCSAHFDLTRKNSIYDQAEITYQINRYFMKNNIPIFIQKCMRVNDNFNSRYLATSRTYLYRIAVIKKEIQVPDKISIASYIPIEEAKKCTFLRYPNFDIDQFKKGAELFVGVHDFSSFKKFDKLKSHQHNRRQIYSIDIRPGKPMVTSYTQNQETLFDYWDITICGRAFVHNQIRRMLGTLVSVATGQLQPSEVTVMLQVPSKHSWHSCIRCLPPDGLFLCNVEYNPEDLVYDPDRKDYSRSIYNKDYTLEDSLPQEEVISI